MPVLKLLLRAYLWCAAGLGTLMLALGAFGAAIYRHDVREGQVLQAIDLVPEGRTATARMLVVGLPAADGRPERPHALLVGEGTAQRTPGDRLRYRLTVRRGGGEPASALGQVEPAQR